MARLLVHRIARVAICTSIMSLPLVQVAAAEDAAALMGKIEGRILDAVTGRGIRGVVVKVERDSDGSRLLSEPTNPSGHYLVKVPLTDRDGNGVHARTLAFDYEDGLAGGIVSLGRPLMLDFRLKLRPTGTVAGVVLDADTDARVANATVEVNCTPACNVPHPPVQTGPDGRYELRGVPFSPAYPLETGDLLSASTACGPSGHYYPTVTDRVPVDSPRVTEDFRIKAIPCGTVPAAPPPPPPPIPTGCTPTPTVDNHGRLVTSCLGPANETDVAVNPTNPLNILAVAKDYSLGLDTTNTCGDATHAKNKYVVWIGVYTSFDGGVTWNNDLLPGFPGGNPNLTNVPGQACMSDPVVAFAPNGDLYLAALAWGRLVPDFFPLEESHLVLARSKDGGKTWDIDSIYRGFSSYGGFTPLPSQWPDKPELAVDPAYASNGTVYVSWDLVSEPNERDVTPMLTTVVNGVPVCRENIAGINEITMPAVLRDHSVAVSGIAFGNTSSVAVSRRLPGPCPTPSLGNPNPPPATWLTSNAGSFFSVAQTLNTTDGYRAFVIPTLAIDRSGGPTDGNLAVAWHSGGLLSSINVAYSSNVKNGGGTWNAVDPPPPASGAQHNLPRVAISPAGSVALLYYQDTLAGGTPLTAQYLAAKNRGQPSWGTPSTLSVPFSPANMFHQTGDVFIGDYVGLTFDLDGNAAATWADGRNNRSDIYFESIPSMPGIAPCPGCVVAR